MPCPRMPTAAKSQKSFLCILSWRISPRAVQKKQSAATEQRMERMPIVLSPAPVSVRVKSPVKPKNAPDSTAATA